MDFGEGLCSNGCQVQFWDLNSTSTKTCCAGRCGKEPNWSGDTLLFADHSKTTRYTPWYYQIQGSYTIHVWYLYLHYIYHENQPNVGKYTIHGSSNPMQFIYCSQNRSAKFQAHHSYAWRVCPSFLEDTQGLVQLYAGIPVPVNHRSGCISCNSMHTYLQCINIQ